MSQKKMRKSPVRPSECEPELYFLKYRSIPTPWECEGNAKRVGFKCIKYASWDSVHASDESASVLKELGNALVDEGVFPVHHYAEFARVWEKVRRWASDKERLSIEPDWTPAFESAARTMELGARDSQYVSSYLMAHMSGHVPSSGDAFWPIFKAVVVRKLLGGTKSIQSLALSVPVIESWDSAAPQCAALEKAIIGLYAALGFKVEVEVPGEGVDLVLEDLGLSVEAPALATTAYKPVRTARDVFIEVKDRLDARLVEARLVENTMLLTLNGRHPALQSDSPYSSYLADQNQWLAVGRACRDQLGNLEEIQAFLDSWGIHLASVLRSLR